MDRYVVIGNPVSHSLSPEIHARFAAQLAERIDYSTLLAPLDDFPGTALRFFAAGGRGANVTLPFKIEALALAHTASDRARAAGAANFLAMREGRIHADNTDGVGLVADLQGNLGLALEGARILLLGAGGAARGVVGPLLACAPHRLMVANRGLERARELVARFPSQAALESCALDAIPPAEFDLVLNATSASTLGVTLALPPALFGRATLAYDMAYGRAAAPFLADARAHGARACDGLGMLVEQAAESYLLWRGRRPATAEVLAALRSRFA